MAKGIEKKLDVAWSKAVKDRAGHKCEHCGKTAYLNSHHIFGRRNKSVRWEISNGCCLCCYCHQFSPVFSAHGAPTAFTQWIIGERGEEWHEELMQMANAPRKWTNGEKEELLKSFTDGEMTTHKMITDVDHGRHLDLLIDGEKK